MLKKTFLVLSLSVCAFLNAQEKTGIAFIPITFDEQSILPNEAKLIHESIVNAFVESKKFTVVDRDKLEDLEKEKKLQRSESFIDSKTAAVSGISKGANYIISSNLLSSRHTELKNKKKESMIQVQIKIIDVSTGEILVTDNITSKLDQRSKHEYEFIEIGMDRDAFKKFKEREESLFEDQTHKDDSFLLAIQRLSINIGKFATKNFPTSLSIAAWTKDYKLEIIGGSMMGIKTGQVVDVVEVRSVDVNGVSVDRFEKLASAIITNADDQNFSVALIMQREKKFKPAFKENKENLKVLLK